MPRRILPLSWYVRVHKLYSWDGRKHEVLWSHLSSVIFRFNCEFKIRYKFVTDLLQICYKFASRGTKEEDDLQPVSSRWRWYWDLKTRVEKARNKGLKNKEETPSSSMTTPSYHSLCVRWHSKDPSSKFYNIRGFSWLLVALSCRNGPIRLKRNVFLRYTNGRGRGEGPSCVPPDEGCHATVQNKNRNN